MYSDPFFLHFKQIIQENQELMSSATMFVIQFKSKTNTRIYLIRIGTLGLWYGDGHTVVLDRPQSCFGLLRMSHLLLHLSLPYPCALLLLLRLSPLSQYVCSVPAKLITWARMEERERDTASHTWCARLITLRGWRRRFFLSPLPKNRLNTWDWPAPDFTLHWTLNKW